MHSTNPAESRDTELRCAQAAWRDDVLVVSAAA
jgi:hypothetical protein